VASKRVRLILIGAAWILAAGSVTWELWAYPLYSDRPPSKELAQIASGGSVLVAATILAVRRPHNRMWMWVLGFGAAGFAQDLGPPSTLLVSIELFAAMLPLAVFVHMVLAYPSGLLRTKLDRAVVPFAYTVAVSVGISSLLLTAKDLYWRPDGVSYWSPIYLGVSERLGNVDRWHDFAGQATDIFGLLVALFMIAASARHISAMRGLTLIQRLPILVAGLAAVLVFLISGFANFLSQPWWRAVTFWSYLAVQALVPAIFVFGAISESMSRSVVSRVIVELERGGAADVEEILRKALRDNTLQIRYLLEDGEPLVDQDGDAQPFALVQGQTISAISGANGPIAQVAHHETLLEHKQLLESAFLATRFALENSRMQAKLKQQRDEIQLSRSRVIDASDQTRRRIERNLHDGAQQRLLGVGLDVEHLRRSMKAGGSLDEHTDQQIVQIKASLREALGELRDLARGLHPAILTTRGLVEATKSLSDRLPISVEVRGSHDARYPTGIESTAYFVVNESVVNALKHAAADQIVVVIDQDADELRIQIVDNGVGGADQSGSGIQGLLDRVNSVGGRLSIASAPSTGTIIKALFPTTAIRS
jgi:signal transduction histidine kinase